MVVFTMYDFDDSTDIFEIFVVGLANSHMLVTNHLATPKLVIFEQWRPDWIWRSPVRQFGDFCEYFAIYQVKRSRRKAGTFESDFHFLNKINFWLKGL